MEKVIFLHGLESGPRGTKATFLKTHCPEVIIPNFDVSLFDLRKQNCPFRSVWMLGPISGALAGLALPVLALGALPLGFIASRKALHESLEKCVTIAQDAVAGAGDIDGIIASSWGGAVALKLLERTPSLKEVPFILVAPAVAASGWARPIYPSFQPETLNGNRSVTILHGTDDNEVPIAMTRKLKEKFPEIRFMEFEGGDHRLNQILTDSTLLKLMGIKEHRQSPL